MSDFITLKEEGNKNFKEGKYEDAIICYAKALEVNTIKDADKATIYKNSAACNLKLKDYDAAIKDATASLEFTPNDPKALFRRCQAYDQIGKVEEAYKDAAQLIKVEPKNTAIQPIFQRLTPIIQERVKQQNSTSAKVSQMFNLAFDKTQDKEKRIQAFNNLIVLAREDSGSAMICKENGLDKLTEVMNEKDNELIRMAIRVFSTLCKDSKERSFRVEEKLGIPKLCRLLGHNNEPVSTATANLMQSMLHAITKVEQYREKVKEHEALIKRGERQRYPQYKLDEVEQRFVDDFFLLLCKMLGNAKVSAHGRDSVLEILIRDIRRLDGVGWSRKFLDTDGLEGLLTIAGTIKQHKTLPTTDQSRMQSSVALSRIYDDLMSDKERDKFKEKCNKYFTDLFGDDIMESKIEAIEAVSTLLQGPFDVGEMILGIEGVSQIMFALANSQIPLHQRVAVEAIVHSASKKKKCTGMLKDAVPILKKLYNSDDDHVKVRALVGLCKFGSFSGTDASEKPMAEGSTLALAKLCRKFLTNPKKDLDLRKWATEGLAFLSLDADIKEAVVEDVAAIQSLTDLAQHLDKNNVYAPVTVFVNLTNSYDVADIVPEMKELAKFAKQHVPEDHPKDEHEYVVERVKKLTEYGVVSALVALSQTDSKGTREQISRVFVAIATVEELRGTIAAQGGAKTLIKLANENNTDNGLITAAHALAKVAVTMNPETAFPGQRIYEAVRPLIQLLHIDRSGLQNFEGLLALTNLASVSDSVRNRILSEKGFPSIEQYMYEEHDMIKRAAVECICNLVSCDKIAEMFETPNDRVKLLTLYCGDEEDEALVKAAAGTLATISTREAVCRKIMDVKPCLEILGIVCANENVEIQQRGVYIVRNIIFSNKEFAEKIFQSEMMEVLMAITKFEDPARKKAKTWAQEALDHGVEQGFIKPNE